MNEQFTELFNLSGMTKTEFAKAVGMKKQNINTYLIGSVEMGVSTFEKKKQKYLAYILRNKK